MTLTNEARQTLFKAVAGLAAFGFAATGHDMTNPLVVACMGLSGNIASQLGMETCMPFITKKWLSGHRQPEVNHHIQRALVAAIHAALTDIETEYRTAHADDIDPYEAESLAIFFEVLRGRSQEEYVDAARSELGKQEILDHVYDPTASATHLQDRLRIDLGRLAQDYRFPDRFLNWFPARFAELVQFHFKEELKGKKDEQEKAKKAMDLLFIDMVQDSLNQLRDNQRVNQDELKTLLDNALTTGSQTLQQVEFYGEIWISAIRQNRDKLDQIGKDVEETLRQVGTANEGIRAVQNDVAHLKSQLTAIYSQPVQPGLLGSPQFQQLTQTLRDTEQAFAGARAGLTALETAIAQNPVLATSLTIPLGQAQQLATATDAQQQQARQNLLQFMADVAATQRAIMDATSHRADVARQLFEQGQFTEANAALSADELRRDKTDLLQQRDAVRAQLAQLAQDFILKANMMVLAKDPDDWFAQARQLFEEAVETDQTYDTCFALGYFLQEHNQHLDAMVWYEKALPLSANESPKSALLNNLGILYRANQRFAEAEAAFDEALTIRRQLAQQNPSAYLPNVATTLNNLANLYQTNQRFAEAEAAYEEALTVYRQLAQQNPSAYLPDVAMTLNNLANLYRANQRFAEAEATFDEALTIRRQLAQQNPSAYLPDVAMTLNNLANLYRANQRFAEAEATFDEALTVYRQLAAKNPDSYSVDAAMTAVNRSMLYRDQPTPDQERSVDCALLALFYAIPYVERVPLALKIAQTAVQICGHWGVDWQAELQKLQDAGGNEDGGSAGNG
jgi:tetratricopeptide (TPR) repeat protein